MNAGAYDRFEIEEVKRSISNKLARYEKSSAIIRRDNFSLATSLGEVRKNNEDRSAVVTISSYGKEISFYIVCDGMGGLDDGEYAASQTIASFIAGYLINNAENLQSRVLQSAYYANDDVSSKFKGRGGSTLSVVIDDGSRQCIALNVGDSRIYTKDVGGKVDQLTVDDTMSGIMNKPQLDSNRLLQFIGMEEDIEPHIFQFEFGSDTNIIISTDGAHTLPDGALRQILNSSREAGDISRKIISVANALGGRDNSTVLCAHRRESRHAGNEIKGAVEIEITTPSQDITYFLRPSPRQYDYNTKVTKEDSPTSSKKPRKKLPQKGKNASTPSNETGEDQLPLIESDDDDGAPRVGIIINKDAHE